MRREEYIRKFSVAVTVSSSDQCSSAPKVRQAIAQCAALCWETTTTLAPRAVVHQGENLVWGNMPNVVNVQYSIFNNECRSVEENWQSPVSNSLPGKQLTVCNLEGGTSERSVTSELYNNRFLISISSDFPFRGTTEGKGVFGMTITYNCADMFAMIANYSMTCANMSMMSADNSMITVDYSMTSADNSMITVDYSMTSMDNSTITVDNSMTSVDNSMITADYSMKSADNSTKSVDSSPATARLHRVDINKAGYNMPHVTIVRQQLRESLQSQSQFAERHPVRQLTDSVSVSGLQSSYSVIPTRNEERSSAPRGRSVTAQCKALCSEGNISTLAPHWSSVQGNGIAWGNIAEDQNNQYSMFNTECRRKHGESEQCSVISVQCHPERSRRVSSRRANEERSVISEQLSNRFLISISSDFPFRGTTEGKGVFDMTGNKKPAAIEFIKLEACGLRLAADRRAILTIKYNNSPSRRGVNIKKSSHLSSLKLAGAREPITIPFFNFLIWNMGFLSSPLGGSPEGEGGSEGYGTFANNLKTKRAYE